MTYPYRIHAINITRFKILKAPSGGHYSIYLSIRIPTLGIFFEKIRSIRAYGDTLCGLRRTLLHRFPGSCHFATRNDPNIRTRFHIILRGVSLPR